MYGLDNASGVNVMPKPAPVSSATPLWFTEGGAGLAASYPGQDWFNMIQAELLNVLTAGGVKPEKGKLTQLAEAISKIVGNGNYATKTELTNGLALKLDKASVVQTTGTSASQVLSQKAISELFQPKGSYVTPTELTNGLALKFDKAGGKLNGGIAATGVSAEKIDSSHRVSIYPPTDDNESSLGYFQYNNGSNWGGRTLIPKAASGQTDTLLVASDIAQTTGSSTSKLVSQKALTDALLGVNQKFTDVKSQREKSVSYTNTTGKPIFIMVSVYLLSTTTGADISLYIDNVKFLTRGGGSGNEGTYKGAFVSAIIPPNSSYKIESSANIDSWGELR